MIHTDSGIRCNRHEDSAFPVRCYACDNLDREWRALTRNIQHLEVCPKHRLYFQPCEKCAETV